MEKLLFKTVDLRVLKYRELESSSFLFNNVAVEKIQGIISKD